MPFYKWVWAVGLTCMLGLWIGVYVQALDDVEAVGIQAPADVAAVDGAPVLLAVGDIATCNLPYDSDTAALVDRLPGLVALVGDIAYPDGSDENFADCFNPVWGRHKARLRPVPGNHEYNTEDAAGYFGYFGAIASPLEPNCANDCKGYYSYDLGDWHIIALNSERDVDRGSAQEKWLRQDLAAHRNVCTLAYWHHPLFSSGPHGSDPRTYDLWSALLEVGVDVVINGHDHHYERFAPQNADGVLDQQLGIRQFVVGTGGARLYQGSQHVANSEAYNSQDWGVLKLTLYPEHYEWNFVPIAGQEYEDSGSDPCVKLEDDWQERHYLPLLY
jgi:acid phosphatase type 7